MVEIMEMKHKPETVSLIIGLVLDDGTCHPDVEKKKAIYAYILICNVPLEYKKNQK